MTEKNPYRIFVCHLFDDDEDYQRVFEYLESREKFFYVNLAKPGARPEGTDPESVKDALRAQIQDAEIVVLPVSLFERDQDLIRFQMDVAQAFGKPILAIQSFGGTVAIQKAVVDAAGDIVEWNDRVITDAIRRLARGEETNQWEVVEFTLE